MQFYQLREFEVKLLEELQRQQNSAQFCDALLQTEGISVPVHSCVLAALSPYFSQQLAATPSPPFGQKRQLPLHGLNTHTLLKLVGLLYSGEVQVSERDENDVMAAIHKFGMTPFVERLGTRKEVEPRGCRRESAMRDAQVQAHVTGMRDVVEKKRRVSTETQLENQPLTPERVPVPSQNNLPDLCESTTNPTSNTDISNDAPADSGHVLTQDGQGTGGTKMPQDENANSAQRQSSTGSIAKKNMAKMKQVNTKQISVKVKLRRSRRKTKGHAWEVVSIQEDEQTMSSFSSLSQEGSSHKKTQKEPPNIQPPPSMAHPPHNTSSESSKSATPPAHPYNTPHPSCRSRRTPPHQHEQLACDGPAEEFEDQLAKMLEDIMKGLNILPNVGLPEDDAGQQKILAAVPASELPCEQNVGIQSEQPSTHAAQDQLNCERVPRVDPDGLMIQQQGFIRDLSAVQSVRENDGSSHLKGSQSHLFSDTTAVDPSLVPGTNHGAQYQHYPPLQDKPPAQNPQFLSTQVSNPNDKQPWSLLSLPCLDDLRLPPCLSPIDPFTSFAVDQPVTNIKQQLSWCTNPWLTERSGLLHFPLAHGEDKRPPLWNPSQAYWPMRCLDHQQSRPCTTNRVRQTAAERKSYPPTMKRTAVQEQSVTLSSSSGPRAPKKRKVRTDHVPDATGSVDYGIKVEKDMKFCSVSLSRNNILAKERNISSPRAQNRSLGHSKLSNSSQTRIKTRGVGRRRRRTREPPGCKGTDSFSDPKAAVNRRTAALNQVPLFKRKRGRPPKTPTAPLVISKSQTEKPNASLKMEPDNSVRKRKCPKSKRRTSAAMPVLREKSANAETIADHSQPDNHHQGTACLYCTYARQCSHEN
ncbi:uncharacterized protein LOC129182227 isoform X2 [Dunckerocampus dactyliophorus]|uniref:uncharacterized protein LOC129182227 isoform X2 n=1 Tax=Dunckerocampus dactyliophorus TaxID=161453 RepID=UPI00240647AB|nr:uncharacterized protein LOC129182227 isoform X2 [Dunckerocampus dactyliophorus]